MELTREKVLAMEAGREMDALVMKVIFGAEKGYYGDEEVWYHHDKNGYPDYEWPFHNSPSTDISAAWEVVERLKVIEKESSRNRPISVTEVGGYNNHMCAWRCKLQDMVNEIVVDAPTAPLAICRAALLTTITE